MVVGIIIKISNHNFLKFWLSYLLSIDRLQHNGDEFHVAYHSLEGRPSNDGISS